jgi:hypothetical protein
MMPWHRPQHKEALVLFRLALIALAIVAALAPVRAADLSMLAPADEYFGHYGLSVLGIANMIRDSGARIQTGADPQPFLDGALAFATDGIAAWEHAYPKDPWIARDLFALENVYLHVASPGGQALAAATAAWLLRDYPQSPEAANANVALTGAVHVRAGANPAPPATAGSAWERFAGLRAPIGP